VAGRDWPRTWGEFVEWFPSYFDSTDAPRGLLFYRLLEQAASPILLPNVSSLAARPDFNIVAGGARWIPLGVMRCSDLALQDERRSSVGSVNQICADVAGRTEGRQRVGFWLLEGRACFFLRPWGLAAGESRHAVPVPSQHEDRRLNTALYRLAEVHALSGPSRGASYITAGEERATFELSPRGTRDRGGARTHSRRRMTSGQTTPPTLRLVGLRVRLWPGRPRPPGSAGAEDGRGIHKAILVRRRSRRPYMRSTEFIRSPGHQPLADGMRRPASPGVP
jgi:hypothetical protein